jgi:hypothetical protein
MKNYKNIFDTIYKTWGFGGGESRSGPGSTLQETEVIREKIKNLVKYKRIKSVVDLPCGDFNWMKEIVDSFDSYHGGDIVGELIVSNIEKYKTNKVQFSVIDVLNDEIPKADLLIVRDIIGHYPIEDGKKIVEKIINSGCKYLLSTTWYNVLDSKYYLKHENSDVEYGRFYPVNLMSEPFNLPEPELIIEEDVVVDGYNLGNRKTLGFWNLEDLKNSKSKNEILTLVTGLWDLNRDSLSEGWARPFEEHYIRKFRELLKTPHNLIIYGDRNLEKIVKELRKDYNTQFIYRDLEWFKTNDYFDKIQKIRTDKNWTGLSGWLGDSTQAKLEMYNPLVMSKMFLLNDAKLLSKFNTKNIYWVDAGITNTVSIDYFTDESILNKLPEKFSKFSFVCFPYDAVNEIHGFKYDAINRYSQNKVNKVARGGFFGGNVDTINEVNSIYYRLLIETLNEGLMGTEESIFTIMIYRYNKLIEYSEIDSNGLIYKFFEDLKNDSIEVKTETTTTFSPIQKMSKDLKVGLYVLTFNSPKQFKTLIDSMIQYDSDFINKSEKYLLDNSTDKTTKVVYDKLCEEYNFTYISKGENLGICGGRQYIAEHFDKTKLDAYYFFEDDMFFYPKENEKCKNGFGRMVKNLFIKSNDILSMNSFDFLKLNFSEFYGDNTTQWAWYNVPQSVREKFWPNYSQLPKMGLDPNAPKTKFNNIMCYQDVPYADGEIYYCNWPQLVSREGNKKMFLDTTWAYPHEQTWMSHMYQLTKEGKLNPGILLLTPTEHNRFDHYERELRKES